MIVTKEASPRLIVVDNPEITVVMEPTATGFNIQQVVNSAADMQNLLAASDQAFATFRLGQADPFITGSVRSPSSGGPFRDPNDALNSNILRPPLSPSPNEALPPSDLASPIKTFVPELRLVTTPAVVDDDGLPGGNANGNDINATFSGVLSFGFGGTGTADFATMDGTTGTVGQEIVSYSWNAVTHTLSATGPRGDLFVVVVNPTTGAFTLTLLDNVLQAQGPNGENDASVELTYTVTHGSGLQLVGTLTVTLDDDAPTATNHATQNVAEGGTVTGTLAFVAGADGASGDAHRRHRADVRG